LCLFNRNKTVLVFVSGIIHVYLCVILSMGVFICVLKIYYNCREEIGRKMKEQSEKAEATAKAHKTSMKEQQMQLRAEIKELSAKLKQAEKEKDMEVKELSAKLKQAESQVGGE
jgi:uncharacterized protein YlxW (UPF0749 family)